MSTEVDRGQLMSTEAERGTVMAVEVERDQFMSTEAERATAAATARGPRATLRRGRRGITSATRRRRQKERGVESRGSFRLCSGVRA
jgi:hypothetical protein